MVDVRTVSETDLDDFRRLHNEYVDRDESRETVREWYREHPELLVGAYLDDELAGHCLGVPRSEETVNLDGIAVAEPHRRRGIGSKLLVAFEERARSLGFSRISLGSAGGYVDEFYVENGYSPASVLVRLDPEDVPEERRGLGFDIVDERLDDGTKKLYVRVDDFDPAFVEAVREAFGDPEAIHIMEKSLESPP